MKCWLQFIFLVLTTPALAYAPVPKPMLSTFPSVKDGVPNSTYDAENELVSVNEAGGWRSYFIYDGLGRRRIERDFVWAGSAGLWVQTNETHFVFDGMLPIQERDQSNNVRVTYTRGLDLSGTLQGAGGIGGLLARTDQGALNTGLSTANTFYHSDGAGNVTVLVNSSQNVVARYLYDPYGRVLGKWGPLADANVMQFSSMPLHRQSGLSLYAFRPYDPSFQRWLTRDPIGEIGGVNLYGFVGNNSVTRIDPLGLSWYDWLNPLSYSSGYARWQGQQALEAQAKANGFQNYADWMDRLYPDDIYLNQKLAMDSLRTAADITKDAANLYLNAATSVTPTGAGAKCVQVAVRTGARNLAEQLALREAEAGAGTRIMQGLIKDPAFPEDVWAKMQHVHGDITIHYWQNLLTGERSGFKFKD